MSLLRERARRRHLGPIAYLLTFAILFAVAAAGSIFVPDSWKLYPLLGFVAAFLIMWQFNRIQMQRGEAEGNPWHMINVQLCTGIDHYWDRDELVDERTRSLLGSANLDAQYHCRYCEVMRFDGVDADGVVFTVLRGHQYMIDGWQVGITFQLGRYQRLPGRGIRAIGERSEVD